MGWICYSLTFRLLSPLHAGYRKMGNVQQTRPYLPGKNLWAALTARLTRDGPESDGDYVRMGERVNRHLAFSYFYPTTHADGQVTLWPWGDDGAEHRYQFLDSYASTALDYARNAAEEASLHEIECICPRTRDGEPVYLSGYVVATNDAPAGWKQALRHLQVGGERGYGWGCVEPVDGNPQPWDNSNGPLFGWYSVKANIWPPVLTAQGKNDDQSVPLLAHALAADFVDDEDKKHKAVSGVDGAVEPLVGRETTKKGRFGVKVSQARICYAPGSTVTAGATFHIGPYGLWEAVANDP